MIDGSLKVLHVSDYGMEMTAKSDRLTDDKRENLFSTHLIHIHCFHTLHNRHACITGCIKMIRGFVWVDFRTITICRRRFEEKERERNKSKNTDRENNEMVKRAIDTVIHFRFEKRQVLNVIRLEKKNDMKRGKSGFQKNHSKCHQKTPKRKRTKEEKRT